MCLFTMAQEGTFTEQQLICKCVYTGRLVFLDNLQSKYCDINRIVKTKLTLNQIK
jgi:hypothetical protein